MIKSMTGYGSAKGNVDGLEITVELKSVNNRFLDCAVRMPRSFLFAGPSGTGKTLAAKLLAESLFGDQD